MKQHLRDNDIIILSNEELEELEKRALKNIQTPP